MIPLPINHVKKPCRPRGDTVFSFGGFGETVFKKTVFEKEES